jgi:hypothetical protein
MSVYVDLLDHHQSHQIVWLVTVSHTNTSMEVSEIRRPPHDKVAFQRQGEENTYRRVSISTSSCDGLSDGMITKSKGRVRVPVVYEVQPGILEISLALGNYSDS